MPLEAIAACDCVTGGWFNLNHQGLKYQVFVESQYT